MKRKLTHSMEDYLEAILILQKDNLVARAKEISEAMDVKMSSVTNALKQLSEKGFINYDKYSYITLTPEGEKYAKEIFGRHQTLKKFLTSMLGIDETAAEDNACRMEHVIDKNVIDRISAFMEYVETDNNCTFDLLDFKKSL